MFLFGTSKFLRYKKNKSLYTSLKRHAIMISFTLPQTLLRGDKPRNLDLADNCLA